MSRRLAHRGAVVGCASAVLLGCYASHGRGARDDASADGALQPLDGAVIDGGDTDSGVPDMCLLPSGLRLCRTDACSPPGTWPPDCLCYAIDPRAGAAPGVCVRPRPEGVLCGSESGCPSPDELCADTTGLVPIEGDYDGGICVSLDICRRLAAGETVIRCFYGDATPYVTGTLAAVDCPTDLRGTLCGPACGDCGDRSFCTGVSEQSGIGLCLPAPSRPGMLTAQCGVEDRECAPDQRCVRVLPGTGAPEVPRGIGGRCVPRSTCERIESLYPERFSCD